MKYEIEYIEKIAKIVADNNLSEITLEDGEQAIVVRKEANVVTTSVVPTVAAPAPAAQAAPVAPVAKEEKASTPVSKGTPITSPMVGAFYAAPAPGAKPFVKVGDTVSTGQVVCIDLKMFIQHLKFLLKILIKLIYGISEVKAFLWINLLQSLSDVP